MNFITPQLTELKRNWHPRVELVENFVAALPKWDRPAVDWLMMRVNRGVLEAYDVAEGLILLETVNWAGLRELSIYGMVGRGILPRWHTVLRDLKLLAEYKSCQLLGGNGLPKGWQRAAPRMGFKPVSTHYVMELEPHGR